MSEVWVVSENFAERALIVAELTEEGFHARGLESLPDLFSAIATGTAPRVLVLDAQASVLDSVKWEAIRSLMPATHTLLIVGAGIEPLPATAVMRRPFSIGELVGKIESLMRMP